MLLSAYMCLLYTAIPVSTIVKANTAVNFNILDVKSQMDIGRIFRKF